MAVLAAGGIGAALSTAWMARYPVHGIIAAVLSYGLIGLGVGASGTALLVLLAKRVGPARRAAAATIVWLMMFAGFALTATLAGRFLDPFSPARLIGVTSAVAAVALLITLFAVRGMEGPAAAGGPDRAAAGGTFRDALAQVWADRQARQFTIFVFVSMLAYSAQELILEPFAGAVFGLPPGASTRLTGVQHGGALAGMLLVALMGSLFAGRRLGALRLWMTGGCAGSAVMLLVLAAGAFAGPAWPLRPAVFALGLANGAFTVAAIGAMMQLAGAGGSPREGVRMGLWGGAQAVAFALGGLFGTLASDLARLLFGSPVGAYALVFGLEAALFLIAAWQAARVFAAPGPRAGDDRAAAPFGPMITTSRG